jgi:hypothetical protein
VRLRDRCVTAVCKGLQYLKWPAAVQRCRRPAPPPGPPRAAARCAPPSSQPPAAAAPPRAPRQKASRLMCSHGSAHSSFALCQLKRRALLAILSKVVHGRCSHACHSWDRSAHCRGSLFSGFCSSCVSRHDVTLLTRSQAGTCALGGPGAEAAGPQRRRLPLPPLGLAAGPALQGGRREPRQPAPASLPAAAVLPAATGARAAASGVAAAGTSRLHGWPRVW